MIPMKVSMLVKLENKEHNLAAALLNLGSASDLLRNFKKKFRGLNLSWGSDKTHYNYRRKVEMGGGNPEPHPRSAEWEFWG